MYCSNNKEEQTLFQSHMEHRFRCKPSLKQRTLFSAGIMPVAETQMRKKGDERSTIELRGISSPLEFLWLQY